MSDRVETWFREPARALAPDAWLAQPVSMLQGVTADAEQALVAVGISTVLDLGASALFAVARSIAAAADGAVPPGPPGPVPSDMLDDQLRGATAGAVAAMHPEMLRALPPGAAFRLAETLPAPTIRDLAYWPPASFARRLVASTFGGAVDLAIDDPEAPAELQPRLGRLPVDRVQYEVLLFESPLNGSAAPQPFDGSTLEGLELPLDLTDALLGRGFDRPGVGFALTMAQSWYGVGLSLGQLIHSLALAPGEATRVAVVDWSRRVAGGTTEDIRELESLQADIDRNRTVGEVTSALSREAQDGFSNVNMTSAGWGIGGGGAGTASDGQNSGTLAIGFGFNRNDVQGRSFASSQGRRDVAAEMVQRAHDRTQQVASLSRGRRASVVSEVSTSEAERLTTRVVANYNHMHALSVLYFEVVQLYRVVTECVHVDPLLYVPVRPLDFSRDALIDRYRPTLAAAALTLDARNALLGIEPPPPLPPPQTSAAALAALTFFAGPHVPAVYTERGEELRDARLRQALGDDAVTGASHLRFNTRAARLAEIQVGTVDATRQPVADTLVVKSTTREESVAFTQWATPPHDPRRFLPERGDSLTAFRAQVGAALVDGDRQLHLELAASWRWDKAVTRDELSFGPYVRLVFERLDAATSQDTGQRAYVDIPLPATREGANTRLATINLSGEPPVKTPAPPRPKFDLVGHLQANALHYTMALLRQADPSLLGVVLGTLSAGGASLLGQVDPVPVATVGNYLVFRWPAFRTSTQWKEMCAARGAADANGLAVAGRRESLVPVASGGVFAEAVLGRFNSAEKLDLTRFWNWQDSPMPLVPPEIDALRAGGRQGGSAPTPTALGDANLQVQDALRLPDPASIGAALSAASKSDSFRDMSGLGALLTTSGTAMTLAAQGAQAFMKTAMQTVSSYGARVNHGKDMDERAKSEDAKGAETKKEGAPGGSGGSGSGSGSNTGGASGPKAGSPGGTGSASGSGGSRPSAEAEAFKGPQPATPSPASSTRVGLVDQTYVFSVLDGRALSTAREQDRAADAGRVDKVLLDGHVEARGLFNTLSPQGDITIELGNGLGRATLEMSPDAPILLDGDLLIGGADGVVTTIGAIDVPNLRAWLSANLPGLVREVNRIRLVGETLPEPDGGIVYVDVVLRLSSGPALERQIQLLGLSARAASAAATSTVDLSDLLRSSPPADVELMAAGRRISQRMEDYRDAFSFLKVEGGVPVLGFDVRQEAAGKAALTLTPRYGVVQDARLKRR